MQTVFDFIDASLEDPTFENSIYRKIYETYAELYYEGDSQTEIVKALLDSPDRNTAYVAAQLSAPPFELTVKNFSDSLMSVESWLVKYVPRAILVYQEKRVEERLALLNEELRTLPPEGQEPIIKKLMTLQKAKRSINVKLGRDKEKE